MFSGTLRENIDPFVRYSDAAVAKAVHDCGLEGRSLDAVVGVSGENFSLGEKQLVCHCSASTSHQQQQPSLLFALTVHTGVPGACVAEAARSACTRRGHFGSRSNNRSVVSAGVGREVPRNHHLVHRAPSRDLALVQDAY